MNKRNQELIEQIARQSGSTNEHGGRATSVFCFTAQELNTFAEKIIRECARIDSEENNCDHIDGVTYNQTILEYFGVSE